MSAPWSVHRFPGASCADYGRSGVYRSNGLPDLLHEGFRSCAGTADGERHIPLNIQRLSIEIRDRKRPVHDRRRLLLDAIIVHVLDDADDLAPLDLVTHLVNSLAKRGRGRAQSSRARFSETRTTERRP